MEGQCCGTDGGMAMGPLRRRATQEDPPLGGLAGLQQCICR